MLKMLLATVVAGAFLLSTPVVRAEDKAPAAEKGKKEKKDEKPAPKKDEKAGGW